MTIVPLGDQAALCGFDLEEAAAQFAARVRTCQLPWVIDVVQAYKTVAVFFDGTSIGYRQAAADLGNIVATASSSSQSGRLHRVPCCYELELDLGRVAEITGLSPEEIIRRHASVEYTVYAIGFCPGFPYLGYLPPELSGVPRLAAPRPRLRAGSIGLTGRQTGIYTEPRPGGWNIVGQTPLELVHVADGYFPLRTGDRVQFLRIDHPEFAKLEGERL